MEAMNLSFGYIFDFRVWTLLKKHSKISIYKPNAMSLTLWSKYTHDIYW